MHGAIESVSGPWQSSGSWWNAEKWARDEWDITVSPNLLLLIYRTPLTNRWYAEGIYD
jgi:protein ImuB